MTEAARKAESDNAAIAIFGLTALVVLLMVVIGLIAFGALKQSTTAEIDRSSSFLKSLYIDSLQQDARDIRRALYQEAAARENLESRVKSLEDHMQPTAAPETRRP